MKISQKGIDLIKSFEGFRAKPYKPVKTETYWTIGYGHYGNDVRESDVISKAEAEEMLQEDLQKYVFAVNSMLKTDVSQNQFDALVSFAYNLGVSALKNSTLLKYVNERKFTEASEEFGKWIHAGGKVLTGLVRRRHAEMTLFLTPDEPSKPKETYTKYTVKKGDVLSSIALKHHTTVSRLMKLNPSIKHADQIYVGQKLKVPKL